MSGEGTSAFSRRVLRWFDKHGRKDLPWQQAISAYRVWVSEIMLQQTQVTTVIPYYERFMVAFPDVHALANAPLDEVLHHWSGLGYYARARNLHKTANRVCSDFDGEFPLEPDTLQTLPGIGRSTAGAIAAIAGQRRAAILDGNVKRVLARYYAIAGWPGQADVLRQLWEKAETHTPSRRVADYTQAMMDLGATLCTRSRPLCASCPLHNNCAAFASDSQAEYPGKKPRESLPVRQVFMLVLVDADACVLLQQRPATGIWGGLWSFPEFDSLENLLQQAPGFGGECDVYEALPLRRHTFSHFHLDITPVCLPAGKPAAHSVMEAAATVWYNPCKPGALGLAAPVARILDQLKFS